MSLSASADGQQTSAAVGINVVGSQAASSLVGDDRMARTSNREEDSSQNLPPMVSTRDQDEQSYVSEVTCESSASLFRGPLYPNTTDTPSDEDNPLPAIAETWDTTSRRTNGSEEPTAATTTSSGTQETAKDDPIVLKAQEEANARTDVLKAQQEAQMEKARARDDVSRRVELMSAEQVVQKVLFRDEEDDYCPATRKVRPGQPASSPPPGAHVLTELPPRGPTVVTRSRVESRPELPDSKMPVEAAKKAASPNRTPLVAVGLVSEAADLGPDNVPADTTPEEAEDPVADPPPDHDRGPGAFSGGERLATGELAPHPEQLATNQDHRQTNEDGLTEAIAVEDNGRTLDLMEAQPMGTQDNKRRTARRKTDLFLVFIATIALAVVVAGVLVWKNKATKEELEGPPPSVVPSISPSSAPSNARNYLLPFLPDYTLESLQDESSPQTKALDWMFHYPWIKTRGMEDWKKTQLFALATFYYATNGDDWVNNTGWLDPLVSECTWFGRPEFQSFDARTYYDTSGRNNSGPCNEEGSYEVLFLYKNNLEGTLPLELFWLTDLRAISVYGNKMEGTLASHVGELSSLEALWVQQSNIISTIPTELGMLSHLKTLSFVRTEVSGPMPSQLGLLSDLETVYLDTNLLSGSIPMQLTKLSRLRSLYLGTNSLTGTIHSEFGILSNLTTFSLLSTNVMGSIPTELGRLTNLDYLSLASNQLTGGIPSELGLIGGLKGFWAMKNELEGTIPSQLGAFVNSTHMVLYSNLLRGTLPTELGRLSSVQVYRLSNNMLSGTIPSELGMMKDTVVLRLHKNELTGSIPSELGLLSNNFLFNLEENNLSGVIPTQLGRLALNASLEAVNVTGNTGIVGTIPEELCILPEKNISVPWVVPHMDFGCSDSLCGCNCGCGFNGTEDGDKL